MGGSEGTGRTLERFADDRASGRSTWRQGELSKHGGIVRTSGGRLGHREECQNIGRDAKTSGEHQIVRENVKASEGMSKRRKECPNIGRNARTSGGMQGCRKECRNIGMNARISEGTPKRRKEHQNVGRSEGALGSAAWDQTTRKIALRSSQRIGGLLERYNQSQGYSDHMSNTWNDVLQ